MAIIKCPECGHDISDKAPYCPSCGAPVAVPNTAPENPSENPNENKAHSKRNNKRILIISVAVVALIGVLCLWMMNGAASDKEKAAYEYAMASSDTQVLQDYLASYADAPEEHRDSIMAHLTLLQRDNQEWTNALASGSRSALQQYLDDHPDSPFKAIALHRIDSIDWSAASEANTVEAMEKYLNLHQDGDYVEQASDRLKVLNAMTVQPEEKTLLGSVFSNFFRGINTQDEDLLKSTVNPLLTSFLGKRDATRSDVITFMHKLYKPGVTAMNWQSANNYSIEKKEIGDGQYEYSVTFAATQSVETEGNTMTSKYRITAKVNPEGLITEMNMVKVAE